MAKRTPKKRLKSKFAKPNKKEKKSRRTKQKIKSQPPPSKRKAADAKKPANEPAQAVPAPPVASTNGSTLAAHVPTEVDLQERLREMVKLAKEQGYLTYDDINEALPEGMVDPDEMEQLLGRLRSMEVDIIDASEVDRYKDGKKDTDDEEEEKDQKLDILDDPVRMYLKQMGQVPLLTREQEVEISKRIEEAENEVKRIIYSFGFSGKEHIALAEKLVSEPPKERFDRVILDKKIDSRDTHLKELRRLINQVRHIDQLVDEKYTEWQNSETKTRTGAAHSAFQKADRKLQKTYEKFFYKQKVIEEMALVAENIHDKINLSLRAILELDTPSKSPQAIAIVESEQRKIRALEEFVRMPYDDYLKTYDQLKIYAIKALQAKTEMVEANL